MNLPDELKIFAGTANKGIHRRRLPQSASRWARLASIPFPTAN